MLLDLRSADLEHVAVADGQRQVVVRAGLAQVERVLDVHLDHLRIGSFLVGHAVAPLECHAAQEDLVGHLGSPV